jgi:hypothetical protein
MNVMSYSGNSPFRLDWNKITPEFATTPVPNSNTPENISVHPDGFHLNGLNGIWRISLGKNRSRARGSNSRPAIYETAALPAELARPSFHLVV